MGGVQILQKKWTSLVKTTLRCLPPFAVLRDVFALPPPPPPEDGETAHALFYAIFSSQWCATNLSLSSGSLHCLNPENKEYQGCHSLHFLLLSQVPPSRVGGVCLPAGVPQGGVRRPLQAVRCSHSPVEPPAGQELLFRAG